MTDNYDHLFNVAEAHYARFAETWSGILPVEAKQAFLAGWFNGHTQGKSA